MSVMNAENGKRICLYSIFVAFAENLANLL